MQQKGCIAVWYQTVPRLGKQCMLDYTIMEVVNAQNAILITLPSFSISLGDIVVSIIVLTVDSDLNGPNPQFTLTCISTGGPATTVTWTRDSTTVTTGTQTVLDDPVTAQYTHTLTVTKRLGGLYACTVANSKPSKSSASLRVKGMSHWSSTNTVGNC